jgi:hypothetical protein
VSHLPRAERDRVMAFHTGCLRRHAHLCSGGRQLLLKSTLAGARLDAMREAMPDARYVHLVRHPYETVPSVLSMFHVPWRAHLPALPKDAPQVHAVARLIVGSIAVLAVLDATGDRAGVEPHVAEDLRPMRLERLTDFLAHGVVVRARSILEVLGGPDPVELVSAPGQRQGKHGRGRSQGSITWAAHSLEYASTWTPALRRGLGC